MADPRDLDEWLRQLECPEACASAYVKDKLQQGVLGLLWEDLIKCIRPCAESLEARKNILLYKLRHEPRDASLQSVRGKVQLRGERAKLDERIREAEERWSEREFACRRKANLLVRTRAERRRWTRKGEILKMKQRQTREQIEDCAKMREICEHLMPAGADEPTRAVVNDCLALVSNYSGGPEKREVLNRISETLGNVRLPALWNALLGARSRCTDHLVRLDAEESADDDSAARGNKSTCGIDVGIARICSEHLDNVARSFIQSARIRSSEARTMEYVERIEQLLQIPDLSNWLSLALEVRKLEIMQVELQKDLEKFEEELPEDSTSIDDRLAELTAEIKIMDGKTLDSAQAIQKSLALLKSSRALITRTREALSLESSESLKQLREQRAKQRDWLHVDLHTELSTFHEKLDMRALRKITIKGETGGGAYKHLSACYTSAALMVGGGEASYAAGNNNNNNAYGTCREPRTSSLPMLRVPVYYLVDFYKAGLANAWLSERVAEAMSRAAAAEQELSSSSSSSSVESSAESSPPSSSVAARVECSYLGLTELTRLADVRCRSALQLGREFEQVLKTWSNQTVREVVNKIFSNKSVHGATLDEWQNRFSKIVYVLQKSNINAV